MGTLILWAYFILFGLAICGGMETEPLLDILPISPPTVIEISTQKERF